MIDYDLLLRVLAYLRDNYDALYKCSLVCKDFNITASWLLYRRVVLSPPFRPVLNLRDRGALTVSEFLARQDPNLDDDLPRDHRNLHPPVFRNTRR